VIGTWLLGLAGGIAGSLACASFVRAGNAATDIDPLTVAGLLAFVASHWIQLALLGAAGVEVAWRAAGAARLGDARMGARAARNETVGKLGEALVAAEIEALG